VADPSPAYFLRVNGRVSRRPSFGLVAILVVLCLFIAVALISYSNVYNSFQRVMRAVDAGVAIRDERRLFLDRQTGLTEYVATHKLVFLEPYSNFQVRIVEATAQVRANLRVLGLTDAIQMQQEVEDLQSQWERTVARPLLSNPRSPHALEIAIRGRVLTDRMRLILNRMTVVVSEDRNATASETRRFVLILVIGSSILAGALAVIAFFLERERASAQRKYTSTLEAQATRDPLTGLLNRRKFEELLDRAILMAERYHATVALLFLDLDGFKEINDKHGHDAGDHVLRTVSRRLLEALRSTDAIARLGGDEFTVMLPSVHGLREAERVAEKLVDRVAEPIPLEGGRQVNVTASVGISVYPGDATSPDAIMKHADEAMYLAKRAGKNCWVAFSAVADA
jgi:diguanylate cyclase (GGDEF)-like protein